MEEDASFFLFTIHDSRFTALMSFLRGFARVCYSSAGIERSVFTTTTARRVRVAEAKEESRYVDGRCAGRARARRREARAARRLRLVNAVDLLPAGRRGRRARRAALRAEVGAGTARR